MAAELERIKSFLKDLDSKLNFKAPVLLYLIGGGAITLAYDHQNRTADLDFIDPPEKLVNLGGQGTLLAQQYGIYISNVFEINFSVPQDWKNHSKEISLGLENLKIFIASVEDLVLGKLARLEPKDFEDIFSLYDLKFLNSKKILSRLNENSHELKNTEYRNNVKLFFSEVFKKKVIFKNGRASFN
ncbi:MAG: hypothetical protein A3G32_06860 [Deltaproteobacteria bacterium RIFCSPLOWO2_12_FULL_40_28]|nr:MAG: hypothetical protein A3C45_06905 [Deltaproteobacteria bacterium RIFCSPHIGHO2_02_FULL_40_28]OGQ19321.1 MAG: hypothetical protein A3E27_04910 [Deltaproteobacteria bacterium RIFCSPHIGHO2_12_FULL_40_32]OGQ40455.1 MAG: hypothetical protein A3I69_00160 [Deltaproteobacteria bacterium RIFCSPLOWO2_02_FULL_40_36]OGQ53691.1 MAG: hypothetical protein A3G32_06860 [Deltaproteobacteria bacterium RIFCSPLOWO2_12_FULL_40_28]